MTQPAKPDVRELMERLDALYDKATYGPCVTHHYACDCREAKLAEEIAQLKRDLEQRDATIKAAREECQAYKRTETWNPCIKMADSILAILDKEQS